MKSFTKVAVSIKKNWVTESQWQACAYIKLARHREDSEGNVLLSDNCMSASEVTAAADALIKQLQDVKRLASKVKWSNHPSRGGSRKVKV